MIVSNLVPMPETTSPRASWVGVVDEDTSLRTALARVMRGNGLRVETFASAEDFLGRPDPDQPACLVLDIHLGGMSGFDLQQRIASEGWSIPIIFITAHDDTFAESARVSGACGYLRKPFDTNALVALVRPYLGVCSE